MESLLDARATMKPSEAPSQMLALWEWYGLILIPAVSEDYKNEATQTTKLFHHAVNNNQEGLACQVMRHYAKPWLLSSTEILPLGQQKKRRGGPVKGQKTLARSKSDFSRFVAKAKAARRSQHCLEWSHHLRTKATNIAAAATEEPTDAERNDNSACRGTCAFGEPIDGDFSDFEL